MSTSIYPESETTAAPADATLDAPLFTPNQVAAASFLCGPLAGFVLIAANFRRLADASAAVGSAAAGIAATLLLWATGYYDPVHLASLRGIVTAAIIAFFLRLVADTLQGPELKAHSIAGGVTASARAALARAVAVAALQFPIIAAMGLLLQAKS